MPGSPTTPGRPSACAGALRRLAFRYTDSVGTQNQFSIAAQWLACTYPCRRFADILADARARLGADVVRYSFIAGDSHPLLLAGLPAHLCKNSGKRCAQIFFPTEDRFSLVAGSLAYEEAPVRRDSSHVRKACFCFYTVSVDSSRWRTFRFGRSRH